MAKTWKHPNPLLQEAVEGSLLQKADILSPAPSTPLIPPTLTRRTSPENGCFQSLHVPPTKNDRVQGMHRLIEGRSSLIESIFQEDKFYGPDGQLKKQWMYRLVLMEIEEDGSLRTESPIPPRPVQTWFKEPFVAGSSPLR